MGNFGPCAEAAIADIRFGVGSLAHLLKNRFYIGEVTNSSRSSTH